MISSLFYKVFYEILPDRGSPMAGDLTMHLNQRTNIHFVI